MPREESIVEAFWSHPLHRQPTAVLLSVIGTDIHRSTQAKIGNNYRKILPNPEHKSRRNDQSKNSLILSNPTTHCSELEMHSIHITTKEEIQDAKNLGRKHTLTFHIEFIGLML